jgi:septal ring factor EnvC (AmiA/AmiB activator)
MKISTKELTQLLAAKDAQIEAKNVLIANLQADKQELSYTISRLDTEIADLKTTVLLLEE